MVERTHSAVEVTYTLGDLYAVTFQSWRRHLAWILLLLGFLSVFLVAIPVLTVGRNIIDAVTRVPWVLLAGFAGLLLLLRMGISPLTGYLDTKREGSLGPTRLELNAEGIRVETCEAQSLLYWSAVKRVVTTRNRLFLFTGPALALVLPKRAFGDQASFEAAITEATERWKTART